MSNAADSSIWMSAEDFTAALTTFKASVTDSVEWPLLKPVWLGSKGLFQERNSVTCLKTSLSMVLQRNGRRDRPIVLNLSGIKGRFFE